jgi:hypothetical protein
VTAIRPPIPPTPSFRRGQITRLVTFFVTECPDSSGDQRMVTVTAIIFSEVDS